MMDAKEVFCALTECTGSKSLGVLTKREYLESGAGRQSDRDLLLGQRRP